MGMPNSEMRKRRVGITGIGPVTPIGTGRAVFWEAAKTGRNGLRSLTDLDAFPVTENVRSRIVAAVSSADLPDIGFTKARLPAMCQRAFELAWSDAGMGTDYDPLELAIVVASAVGATAAMERSFLMMDQGNELDPGRAPADLLAQVSFHTLAHGIAEQLNAEGPVLTVSTGCTAGIDAIGIGAELIRSGRAGTVIVVAAEAPIAPIVYASFDSIGALSTRNHEPSCASRPFDKDRDGFVLAEGACAIVLEDLERARDRKAYVYAEVSGYASVSNAYHMTDLPADGAALSRCIRECLTDAALQADAVGLVNAHGSSTPQNDICETNAIKDALGTAKAYRTPVNSLKSMVGHALGASNAIEIAACALAIEHQFAFPTINFERPGVGCDLDYVPNTGRSAHIEHLLKLSSGFSGIHSALVLSHAEL